MANLPIIEKKYFLKEKVDETPEVLTVRLDPEDGNLNPFEPGMFSMISGLDKDGKKCVARAYSIASDPGSKTYEFYVVKEHGGGRTHFLDAQVGDPFFLKGPNGQFRFDPNKDGKVLFIAGGTGLAPFMSMLRHIKVTGAKTDVHLLYSIKFPNEIIRKGELEGMKRDIGLKMDVTVTRPQPGDGWTGLTGHVNADMIKGCTPDYGERMCYICGPLPFVKAVKDALAAIGIPPARISADVWG